MAIPDFRVVLIGCVHSTEVAFRTLLSLRTSGVECVGLVTRRASSFNTDFIDLAVVAEVSGVEVLFIEDCTSEAHLAVWLRQKSPDLALVVGWSRLLGVALLSIPRLGTIGYHPAALPANRGRHPIVWALALGLGETASSFFLMGEGADDGPIVSQKRVSIGADDDARVLYDKLLALIPAQISEILNSLMTGQIRPVPQDHHLANTWRKRSASDGCIDWRMGSKSIYNLVRALASPYPGAHFLYQDKEIKVWKCRPEAVVALNIEPGKVMSVNGECVVVKTGDGAIRLIETSLSTYPMAGDYL